MQKLAESLSITGFDFWGLYQKKSNNWHNHFYLTLQFFLDSLNFKKILPLDAKYNCEQHAAVSICAIAASTPYVILKQ